MEAPQPIASTAGALLAQRCPRCHTGRLFSTGTYSLSFTDMPAACPVCGQAYEPEPGFYYGAMYISFGFATGLFLFVGLGLYYLAGDPSTWVYVTTVAAAVLLLAPVMYRYSRALMLYLFGGVRGDARYFGAARD